ncbi:MAG: proline--tRNA ligase [Candidatus Helarchaeota archaeon]|nr:proline--tRNA ligase [Candidatus Helarchaeota archaeon]
MAKEENEEEEMSMELPKELGVSKAANFSVWYNRIIQLADLIEKRYNVAGMFVWKPYGFRIMNQIKKLWDKLFVESSIQETYFPLIVPLEYAQMNKAWFDGFEDEVFWVKGRGEGEPTHILRPTGEPAMYPIFTMWIRSYKDLPLRIYETVSSFRYETKHTRPLIRDREITFWYEIHTAHTTKEESEKELKEHMRINDLIWDALAIPNIKVEKPQWEVFPGAIGAIEYYNIMPNGRMLENGSCNNLGQAYAKKFNITYVDENNQDQYVWQTCTGNGARYLVAALALHGDDKGLILPPRIAPIQVIIIPIFKENIEEVLPTCKEIAENLSKENIPVKIDDVDKTPGEKFYIWEIKGVPLRLEIGPKEVKEHFVTAVRRDLGKRQKVEMKDLTLKVAMLLEQVQNNLYLKVQKFYDEVVFETDKYTEMKAKINEGGVALVYWCQGEDCADEIQRIEGVEIVGITLDDETTGDCIICGKSSGKKTYVARTY